MENLLCRETYRLFSSSLTSSGKDKEAGRGSTTKEDVNVDLLSSQIHETRTPPFGVVILTKLYPSRYQETFHGYCQKLSSKRYCNRVHVDVYPKQPE